jgi:polyphosphate:AMP phosphotransferase
MFAAAELGQKISKQKFAQLEPELRYRLLQAQHAIQSADIPVIILLAGVEGSDRSGVVKRLNKWLDPRYLRTHAFWDETDEEKQRPLFWRYWRCMPQRGQTAIMFGSWYSPPIIDRVFDRLDDNALTVALESINNHERMLCADNHLIIKLWFHIDRDTQQQRLQKKTRFRKSPTAQLFSEYAEHYQHFLRVSEQAIRTTDTPQAPWHIIEATNKRYRDLTAAEIIIRSLEAHLQKQEPPQPGPPPLLPSSGKTLLDNINLGQAIDNKNYAAQLSACQKQLAKLVWQAHEQQRTIICLFEGWDASGKGGAIRRVTSAIDARLYKVISVAAPSDEELAHHYLWRFWRHIPRDGYMTVYDRSWYGRVLVERVEGLASEPEWQRAYHEINNFEQQLIGHRVILFKYWLHVDKQEQLKRFEDRERTPWKQHKITEEDWRNREKWTQYEMAIQDMISKTSTAASPWTLIASNDKKFGRIQVLQSLCRGLQQSLS